MNIIINNIPCTNIFALNDKYAKIKEKNYAPNQASFKGNLHVNQTISSKVFSNICPKNLIGEGKNSKVYNFLEPEFKDYVIKVIKPDAIVCRSCWTMDIQHDINIQYCTFGEKLL